MRARGWPESRLALAATTTIRRRYDGDNTADAGDVREKESPGLSLSCQLTVIVDGGLLAV